MARLREVRAMAAAAAMAGLWLAAIMLCRGFSGDAPSLRRIRHRRLLLDVHGYPRHFPWRFILVLAATVARYARLGES